MIILYNDTEKNFTSLGLGVLRDVISCTVREELNGSYELEMEYPVNGTGYKNISLRKIILVKPNTYDRPQPFRIYEITKPLSGRVIVNAEHISYDMSGYVIKGFESTGLLDALSKIQNGTILPSPFKFFTDKISDVTFKTRSPYNMRSLLAGSDGSIANVYGGEFKFDRFDAYLKASRGLNRGVKIRYGKNLTDLEQELETKDYYTGVFPFYYLLKTETKASSEKVYWPKYIVPDILRYDWRWLCATPGAKSDVPIVQDIPVQIKTDGDYKNKVYVYKRFTPIDSYEDKNVEKFSAEWLYSDENLTTKIIPQEKTIYKVKNEGDYFDKKYIWNYLLLKYIDYTGDGFYIEPDPVPPPYIINQLPTTIETEEYLDLTSAKDSYIHDGGVEFSSTWLKSVGTDTNPLIPIDKELYLIKTTGSFLNRKYMWNQSAGLYQEFTGDGIIYIHTGIEQKILTLDLSSYFNEKPSRSDLDLLANVYIVNNQIGQAKESTKVSFINLSDSAEYERFKDLEKVELGDTISVFYEKLGVETELRVISTDFDVISERYIEVELGKKLANIVDKSVSNGDSISSMTNDAKYADISTVNKLVAKNITADYIQAANASLSTAQIEELQVAKIRCSGIIEASVFDIDELVAKLMTADNAVIRNTLTAGTVVVRGTIFATSGKIGGIRIEDDTIVAGEDEDFKVSSDGSITAKKAFIEGNVKADVLTAQKVQIEDAIIQYETGGGMISQTVDFSSTIVVSYDMENTKTYITVKVYSKVNGVSSPVWVLTPIRVTIGYKVLEMDPETFETYYVTYNVATTLFLSEGLSYVEEELAIDDIVVTPSISGMTPVRVVENKSSTGPQLSFGAAMIPSITDIYNLGSPSKRWATIYVNEIDASQINGLVITKEEVEDATHTSGRLITGQRFKEGVLKHAAPLIEKIYCDPEHDTQPPSDGSYKYWIDVILEE